MKNDFLSDMCCSAARIYRTLNKPVLDSDIDVDCRVKSDENAEAPAVSLKVKGSPTVKLLDLILVLSALKLFFTLISSLNRLFRR